MPAPIKWHKHLCLFCRNPYFCRANCSLTSQYKTCAECIQKAIGKRYRKAMEPIANTRKTALRTRTAQQVTAEVKADREAKRHFQILPQSALAPCEGTCKRGGYHRVAFDAKGNLRCDCIGFQNYSHCKHADKTASVIASRVLWMDGTATASDLQTLQRAIDDLQKGAGLLITHYLYTAIDYGRLEPTQVRYGYTPTFENTRFWVGLETQGSQPTPFQRAACRYFLNSLLNEIRAAQASAA
jgi:hypothetical protein